MGPVCPFCANALPGDAEDGELIVCLGCAAHLRRRGDGIEVDAPPPGEAVPTAVEREDTDRAVVGVHFEPSPAVAGAACADDPAALPPLPAMPTAPEANAPRAPTEALEDRTPTVGVPLGARTAAAAQLAAPAAQLASAAAQLSSPAAQPVPPAAPVATDKAARARSRTRAVVGIAVVIAAVVAILVATLQR